VTFFYLFRIPVSSVFSVETSWMLDFYAGRYATPFQALGFVRELLPDEPGLAWQGVPKDVTLGVKLEDESFLSLSNAALVMREVDLGEAGAFSFVLVDELRFLEEHPDLPEVTSGE
jgi:hypothetical protein